MVSLSTPQNALPLKEKTRENSKDGASALPYPALLSLLESHICLSFREMLQRLEMLLAAASFISWIANNASEDHGDTPDDSCGVLCNTFQLTDVFK